MTVVSVMLQQMQVHPRVRGDGFPEDFNQLAIEVADLLGRILNSINEGHSSAEIDSARHQRLFHWKRETAVAREAGLITECLSERLSEADADVFDGVMKVDINVALRRHREVEQTVLCEQRQHVIEESDASVDLGLPGAVEIQLQNDVGFSGAASDGRDASHESCS